ncbi:uncharacterized protein STEHIDRAFT_47497 [Stereum hirsutum FP-91666 SS1]|uniref:uncharacterized protein n=1 Tax=Stereum hirsutum (strain FP-91666) TaxID=721885 RepID=UPI000440A840|nr:uncharacterized protein STEHIDRAFT_47497 [Stereum hirsutum FP-91666 SS1]EIM92147.1 hypothetical protein STEHIDRAFT_47497 [Stereum hirsutum FP-91666 SS1]
MSTLLLNPLYQILSLVGRGARPIAPVIIPVAICTIAIPILLLFSLSSGFYVWRSVAVGWEAPLYLQYGDGGLPWADASLPYLSASQPYDVSLHLLVPTTQSNYDLGNFMTSLTLSTTSNKTLTSVRRPSIVLPPKAYGLLSRTPTTVDLEVELLTTYVTGTNHVVARVEIGRKDGWSSIGEGHGKELSILSALLVGKVRYRGILGIVSRFPIITSLIATATFLTISAIILAACVIPAVAWTYHSDAPRPEPPSPASKSLKRLPSQTSLSEKRARKKTSLKRSKSLNREVCESFCLTSVVRVAMLNVRWIGRMNRRCRSCLRGRKHRYRGDDHGLRARYILTLSRTQDWILRDSALTYCTRIVANL